MSVSFNLPDYGQMISMMKSKLDKISAHIPLTLYKNPQFFTDEVKKLPQIIEEFMMVYHNSMLVNKEIILKCLINTHLNRIVNQYIHELQQIYKQTLETMRNRLQNEDYKKIELEYELLYNQYTQTFDFNHIVSIHYLLKSAKSSQKTNEKSVDYFQGVEKQLSYLSEHIQRIVKRQPLFNGIIDLQIHISKYSHIYHTHKERATTELKKLIDILRPMIQTYVEQILKDYQHTLSEITNVKDDVRDIYLQECREFYTYMDTYMRTNELSLILKMDDSVANIQKIVLSTYHLKSMPVELTMYK